MTGRKKLLAGGGLIILVGSALFIRRFLSTPPICCPPTPGTAALVSAAFRQPLWSWPHWPWRLWESYLFWRPWSPCYWASDSAPSSHDDPPAWLRCRKTGLL